MTVIPIYQVLVAPDANTYFQTNHYRSLTGKPARENERVVFVITRENQNRKELSDDSFYPIGLSGTITEVNPNGYLVIHTGSRVHIDEIHVNMDHSIELVMSKLPETEDMDESEEQERFSTLRDALKEFSSHFEWDSIANAYLSQWHSIADIACAFSIWLSLSNEERYDILAVDSHRKRIELMEKAIYEYIEIAKVTNDAENAQKEDYKNIYKEQAIKKQMEYLQKELDALHPENVSDLRKMELAIEDSLMNDEARDEANKVLNRLKQEGGNSHEYGMLYDYLDFVTSLSWKKEDISIPSLSEAERILDEEHFGLKKIKRRIIEQLAVMSLNRRQSGSILLFVGAPGTGKTSIGTSIAKALGRKYVRVSLGGVRDEADIRGHRRTYIGAMPGRIMDGIKKSGVSNPVMVLDEVDKIASSYHGDPASALLEVLDPEQNHTFTDHYMNVPYDLSDVLFICTANETDTIPGPLLDRMEVIRFPGYTATDKKEIAARHLLPKAMESAGISPDQLSITEEALEKVIADFTREAGVRGLKKRLDTLCRAVAVKLARGEDAHVEVQPGDVRKLLDTKPIRHDIALQKKRPGVVTGLAWTAAGGDILFIETLFTKGDGKITITGQLGDVMKESVQIAVSLVKSMFPDKAKLFKENDLHIHVPEGAVPKDGPSAGITLTCALASLVTGRVVEPTIAMTGEVSLRGVVSPIGGLPEKLMAAMRAGIQKVLIPEENVEDLEDVADEIKSALTIVPVSEVPEALHEAGLIRCNSKAYMFTDYKAS